LDALCREHGEGGLKRCTHLHLSGWKSRGTYRLELFTDGGTTWRLIFKDEYYCQELIPAMEGLPASPGPPEALIYRLQSPFLSPFLPQLFWFREIEPGRRFQYLLEDLAGTCGELHLGKLPHIRAVRNLRRIQEVLGETFKGEHPDGLIRYDRRYSERLLDYAAISLAEYAAQTREDAVATLRARWRDVVSVHQREEFYENGLRVPIHGDFSRSNIHVHRDNDAELKVVDWEWAGIGLPHADLAALVKSVYREDHPALLRAFVEGDRRFDPEQHQRLFHWCQLERRLLDAAFLAKQQLSSSRRVAWLQPDIKQAAGDVLAEVEWLNAAACSGGA
jgi:hypothetical protein